MIIQVLSLASLLRDIVFRRRFIWSYEKVFLEAFRYALKANDPESAIMSLMQCIGLGWRATGKRQLFKSEILRVRKMETGPALIGEELFSPKSMRDGVCGPELNTLPGIFGDMEKTLNVSDTIARSERLQLLREKVFGLGEKTQISLIDPPDGTLEIYFLSDSETIHRCDRWNGGYNFELNLINKKEIRSRISTSGLSITKANRVGPVDFAPIDAIIKKLLVKLPKAANFANKVKIWPHGLLHMIPYTYAIGSILKKSPLVSVMIVIEACHSQLNKHFKTIRIAPLYESITPLPNAVSEVIETQKSGDLVKTNVFITADDILKLLMKKPSLFHFAGHAVNRNDHPEFAGLYGSDNEIVSAADILNLGIGPEATVLSACETGVGPLHSADGSYNLVRSFLQTGSKWVLASLWKVRDAETLKLVKHFFDQIAKGREPEEALPHSTRHPFVIYRPSF